MDRPWGPAGPKVLTMQVLFLGVSTGLVVVNSYQVVVINNQQYSSRTMIVTSFSKVPKCLPRKAMTRACLETLAKMEVSKN